MNKLTVHGGGLADTVSTASGRVVVMQRRSGADVTGFVKRPDGSTANIGTMLHGALGDAVVNVGHFGTGNDFETRGPIEGVFIRKGTFTDAECLAIVGAA